MVCSLTIPHDPRGVVGTTVEVRFTTPSTTDVGLDSETGNWVKGDSNQYGGTPE